mmetsp:Transcript_59281/g.157795  ORF Transcript_59281/g.157795 Transcript_59281/m.157795 type:complete len:476 (+) Transcript_59281:47-1474(+)
MSNALHYASACAVLACCVLGLIQTYFPAQDQDAELLGTHVSHHGPLHHHGAGMVVKKLNAVSKPAAKTSAAHKQSKKAPKGSSAQHRALNFWKSHDLHKKGRKLPNIAAKTIAKALLSPSPKKMFQNIKTAMLKDLKLFKPSKHGKQAKLGKHKLQMKADAEDEEDDQVAEEDPNPETNFDPERSTVYVYAGREVKPRGSDIVSYILQSGLGVEKVGYINSASDADVRSALWDEDCKAVIFPPLKDIPDFGPNAAKDFKAFVSQGFHNGGTVMLLGSPVEVHLINELFGFELQQDYKEGPYYKNGRYTPTSVWEALPSRLREQGQTEALGLLESTLPPESKSYYDSFGDSVAACTRYDLGRVCYLAQDFSALAELPELLVEAEGGSSSTETTVVEESEDGTQTSSTSSVEEAGGNTEEAAARRSSAQAEIDEMEHDTDTWLGVFTAMLEQTENDISEEVEEVTEETTEEVEGEGN